MPANEHKRSSTRTIRDLHPYRNTLMSLPDTPRGVYDNWLDVNRRTPLRNKLAVLGASGVPVASDIAGLGADAMMYAQEPESRTWGNYLMSALGTLPLIPAMTAYHGSPHKYGAEKLVEMPDGKRVHVGGKYNELQDVPPGGRVIEDFPLGRVRMEAIGTGEGAQAYGHGLYFAEDPKVAGTYKTQKNLSYNGKPSGSLYTVDIPDESIAKMLDWDAPLSEQPEILEKLRQALSSGSVDDKHARHVVENIVEWVDEGGNGPLGSTLIEQMGKDEYASAALKKLGIPGIKYYDAGSRMNVGKTASRLTKVNGRPISQYVPDTGDFIVDNQLENLMSHLEQGEPYKKVLGIAEKSADPKTVSAFRKLKIEVEEAARTRNLVVFDDSILKILNRE